MALEQCEYDGCTAPALRPGLAKEKIGHNAPAGLCGPHTIRSIMEMERKTRWAPGKHRHVTKEFTPAAEYNRWVATVLSTGAVRHKDLVLHELRQKDLAKMTGLHYQTIGSLKRHEQKYVRPPVANVLNPLMFICQPVRASFAVGLGDLMRDRETLRRAPLHTGAIDRYGRMWQHRGDGWAPCHTPGELSRYMHNTVDLHLPLRVVYLPPRLLDSTQI